MQAAEKLQADHGEQLASVRCYDEIKGSASGGTIERGLPPVQKIFSSPIIISDCGPTVQRASLCSTPAICDGAAFCWPFRGPVSGGRRAKETTCRSIRQGWSSLWSRALLDFPPTAHSVALFDPPPNNPPNTLPPRRSAVWAIA